MKRRTILSLAAALGVPLSAHTQPDRTIRIIVPYPAGGNADNIARLFADSLSRKLAQPVIIDNRPGAGAIIGAQAAARSPADGTSFFIAPTAVFVVTPHLKQTPYDPLNDFVPVAKLTSWIPMMVLRKDFPANNLTEMVAELRKNPGRYSFASAGPATMTHLMGELLNQKLATKVVHVPYKGSAEFIADLLSGRIDMVYDSVVVPQVKAGQLKAIASMSNMRHPELPNVPTLKESGVDMDIPNWYGLFAPRGTSREIIDRMSAASREVVDGLDKDKLTQMSMAPAFQGPAEFKTQLGLDDALMRDVIKNGNIQIS